jgi:maltose alpha-D-glucosyltransferase/alpha-amylase
MPRIFKSVALGDNSSLIQTLKDTPVIPENCQWCTFLRNHDELTLEMVTEEDRQLMWRIYAPEERMRLNMGIRRRLAPLMEGDTRKIELLFAILFSLPGTPIIYYGDEIGMGDNVPLPDRDGVRTPMQWSAEKNAGFSTADPQKLFLPVIDNGHYRYEKINVEAQLNEDPSLLNRLRSLILTRKAYPVFSTQFYRIREDAGTEVFMLEREDILCLHNLSDRSKQVELGGERYMVLHSSMTGLESGLSIRKILTLEPFTFAWLIQTIDR